jgi:hypothetical protein
MTMKLNEREQPIDPPTIAVPTSREPQPAEPVLLPVQGEVWVKGDWRRIPFVTPADRLHWIGYDGVELVEDPLELLDYIAWMVAEAEPEQVQAVVRGCMGLVSYLEGHSDE